MARLDSRRIGTVVLSIWRRHFDQRGTKSQSRAIVGQGHCRSGMYAAACEAGLELLIRRHRNPARVCDHHAAVWHATDEQRTGARSLRTSETRRSTGDEPAIEPPVKSNPGSALPRLIWEVSRLVEFLFRSMRNGWNPLPATAGAVPSPP